MCVYLFVCLVQLKFLRTRDNWIIYCANQENKYRTETDVSIIIPVFSLFFCFLWGDACVCVFVSDKQEEKNYLPHAIHRGRCPRPAKYVKNSDVQICPSSVALISRPVVFDLIWKSFSIVVMTLTKYVKYIPCGKTETETNAFIRKCWLVEVHWKNNWDLMLHMDNYYNYL